MKKLLIILPFILCGCRAGYDGEKYWAWESLPTPPPEETVCKEGTIEVQRVYISQVANDVLLINLHECSKYNKFLEKWVSDETCDNRIAPYGYGTLAILRDGMTGGWKDDLYDGKIMNIGDKCVTIKGTYSYTTAVGSQRTIRKIASIGDRIPNPAYKEWQDQQGN